MKQKPWEWHLRVREKDNTDWWTWELWTYKGRIFIVPNDVYVSEKAALNAGRRVMKRLGFVEKKT